MHHNPEQCPRSRSEQPSMLQDDFKITKKIATGGFGTVYRAELDDGKTPGGRPVIIKKVSHIAACIILKYMIAIQSG